MNRKRLASLLAAFLVISAFSGCGGGEKASSDASSEASLSQQSTATEMPTTQTEIVRHNDLINPDDVNLLQLTPPADAKYATIQTSMGTIKVVLYPSEAPKAVENFIALAQDGFYNGMRFYEVYPEARISAGATDVDGMTGKSASGSAFADEYSLNLWHFNGALAMNNGSVSGENDSRFYIVQNKTLPQEMIDQVIDGGFPQKVIDQYIKVGGLPACDFRDTVFGQVVEGMDVVEQIALVERDGRNKPKADVTIESIVIS